jgi:RimJ/RimL family protein N-acetyltransferase
MPRDPTRTSRATRIKVPLPLTTNRLRIERFDEGHLGNPSYLDWLSDRENLVSLNLIDYLLRPVTQERLAAYYAGFKENAANTLFAVSIAESNRFIGTATLREIGYRGLYDLGILIGDKSVRGRGLARETIGAVAKYAFEDLQARKICSSFANDNVGVLLAFLKNGFKIEGLQRQQQLSIDGKISDRYIVGMLPSDVTQAARVAK